MRRAKPQTLEPEQIVRIPLPHLGLAQLENQWPAGATTSMPEGPWHALVISGSVDFGAQLCDVGKPRSTGMIYEIEIPVGHTPLGVYWARIFDVTASLAPATMTHDDPDDAEYLGWEVTWAGKYDVVDQRLVLKANVEVIGGDEARCPRISYCVVVTGFLDPKRSQHRTFIGPNPDPISTNNAIAREARIEYERSLRVPLPPIHDAIAQGVYPAPASNEDRSAIRDLVITTGELITDPLVGHGGGDHDGTFVEYIVVCQVGPAWKEIVDTSAHVTIGGLWENGPDRANALGWSLGGVRTTAIYEGDGVSPSKIKLRIRVDVRGGDDWDAGGGGVDRLMFTLVTIGQLADPGETLLKPNFPLPRNYYDFQGKDPTRHEGVSIVRIPLIPWHQSLAQGKWGNDITNAEWIRDFVVISGTAVFDPSTKGSQLIGNGDHNSREQQFWVPYSISLGIDDPKWAKVVDVVAHLTPQGIVQNGVDEADFLGWAIDCPNNWSVGESNEGITPATLALKFFAHVRGGYEGRLTKVGYQVFVLGTLADGYTNTYAP